MIPMKLKEAGRKITGIRESIRNHKENAPRSNHSNQKKHSNIIDNILFGKG
jgi:hypothetical protein